MKIWFDGPGTVPASGEETLDAYPVLETMDLNLEGTSHDSCLLVNTVKGTNPKRTIIPV